MLCIIFLHGLEAKKQINFADGVFGSGIKTACKNLKRFTSFLIAFQLPLVGL
jgi:hypothetical protein